MNIHVNTPYEIRDGETIRRAFTGPVIKAINKEERQIEFIISTAAEDRYGDTIQVNGWDLKQYKRNPIVLFGHLSMLPPIGKAVKTWKDGDALRSIAQFMPPDLSTFADSIFRMYLEGYLRAVSVGFKPIKYERILDEEGNPTYAYNFQKQELLEFSAVPIPANPEALVAARQKGIDTLPFKAWAEEILDNWSVVDKDVGELYGVAKKDIENIRRRAAGAGAAIQVPPDVQDDLLRRNLEAVRQSKAAKAAKEFQTVELNGEEYDLPICAPVDGTVQLSMKEEEGGPKVITIDKADDVIMLNQSVLDADFTTLGKIEHDGGATCWCAFEDDKRHLTYGLTGITAEGNFIATKLSDKEKEEVDPEPEVADTPDPEETEPDEVEEQEQDEPEAVDIEEIDEPIIPEDPVIKELEEVDLDGPVDLPTMLTVTEEVLGNFERVLDDCVVFTTREKRKSIFLASYMRELADRIDGGKPAPKAAEPVVPTKAEKTADFSTSEDVQAYLKNVTDQLQPMLAEIIASKLAKLRGRLD
jgi:HK97 family phage prohead protease